MKILDLSSAPNDPIERLLWLSGVREQVENELRTEFEECYFWARLTHRLDDAMNLHLHSRKRVMAYTRAGNEQRGRTIRWNDGRS